jgi:hypothetical protein
MELRRFQPSRRSCGAAAGYWRTQLNGGCAETTARGGMSERAREKWVGDGGGTVAGDQANALAPRGQDPRPPLRRALRRAIRSAPGRCGAIAGRNMAGL